MARLTTIKPRVKTVGRLLQPVVVERMSGRANQRRRARLLSAEPRCVHCLRDGFITLAAEVDHVVPLWAGGADDDDNCAGLCRECHRRKSAAEAALRARG